MSPSPYKNRLKTLRKKFKDKSFDILWIIQPENRRYLSGFKAGDLQLDESSGSLFITRRKALLITDSRYTEEAEKEAADFKVIDQKGLLQDELLRQVKKTKGSTLGFEGGHLTWDLHKEMFSRFKKLPSPVKMKPLKGMVEEMRLTKDPSEIKLSARSDGDDYVLEGEKIFVSDAHVANYILVVARTGKGKTPEREGTLLCYDISRYF